MPLAEKPITSCQARNLSPNTRPGRLLNGCGWNLSPTEDGEDVFFTWSPSLFQYRSGTKCCDQPCWFSVPLPLCPAVCKGGLASCRAPMGVSRVSLAFVTCKLCAITTFIAALFFLSLRCLPLPFSCSRSSRDGVFGGFRVEVYSCLIRSLRELICVSQEYRELFCYYFIKSAFFGKGDS